MFCFPAIRNSQACQTAVGVEEVLTSFLPEPYWPLLKLFFSLPRLPKFSLQWCVLLGGRKPGLTIQMFKNPETLKEWDGFLPIPFLVSGYVQWTQGPGLGQCELPSHTCAVAQGWHTWKFLLGGIFFALSPGNSYWVKYSLQPHIFCLFPTKEKLKSPEQVQGWDFKGCCSCTALWHAAMCPWCKGSKWDTLGVLQGRKHRGILHLASQSCSTYVIPR